MGACLASCRMSIPEASGSTTERPGVWEFQHDSCAVNVAPMTRKGLREEAGMSGWLGR